MKANFITKEIIDSLSPLESVVINAIKPNNKYRVKDVYALIKTNASKSSIPVILDRLYIKGLLNRKVENSKGGIRFIYTLNKNKEQFERSIVDSTINALIRRFGSKAIVYFNESLKKKR